MQNFPYSFPIYLIGLWLLVTTVFGLASGWFHLQTRYPNQDEQALLLLRGRSGSMGLGITINGILTMGACPSGMRIAIPRLFGPFQAAIFVPWQDIKAVPSSLLFAPAVQLLFGAGAIGKLKIDARSWERLHEAAARAGTRDLPPKPTPLTKAKTARGFLMQWAAVTIGAGTFFYAASRSDAGHPGIPIAVCYGFPGIVFGIVNALRFFRQV